MRYGELKQRGDTIVEVLFATAALSLVIVISFVIMNRGVASAQVAVENTFARQAIDAQAESLRYLRDAYIKTEHPAGSVKAEWERILTRLTPNATPFGTCDVGAVQAKKAFYIDTTNATVKPYTQAAQTFAGAELGQGLWVEAVQPTIPAGRSKYIDFHIRACWEPPATGPNITTGTIVRLYVL
jgi:type II secretory pathway pseudopilin PulG